MATTERGEGAYHDIMAELYVTDIPGFTNFMRMTPEFIEMIKTRLEPHLARQATNYRATISVGEKLAITIRYLATGESYISLSCQFRVGRSTIHHLRVSQMSYYSRRVERTGNRIQDQVECSTCPGSP